MTNDFQLDPHTVHLWCLDLRPFEENSFRKWLDSDELERADRFHFPHHRQRFTITHGLLRKILGQYTHQLPENIEFSRGARGKPFLKNNPDHIQFNLSHSDEVAVVALTKEHEIGVDIEKVEPQYNEGVAKRFFAEKEYQEIIALPEAEQVQAFYQLWACKEALIKAVGEGLYKPLGDFIVSLENPSQWITVTHQEKEKQFYLQMFDAFPQFRSAFATDQTVEKVIYRKG